MKTKLYLAAIVVSAASVTAAPLPAPMPNLVTQEWHSSPPDKVTSRFFGVVQWDQVPLIKIGISEKQLRIISPVVNPFGDVDGLIYAVNPRGVRYEIEVMIKQAKVFDISYKPCLIQSQPFALTNQETKQANKKTEVNVEKIRDAIAADNSGWTEGTLPEDHWPAAVKNLKPIRVYSDRANRVIAMSQKDNVESGYYVYVIISSYLPTDNDEWTFTWVANNIWTYKRNQNNKENKSEMATPRKPAD